MLVDSHCHLDFDDFKKDFKQVIDRANQVGVGCLQTICTKITKFPQVLKIAEENKQIFCSVGIHPHEVEKEPEVSAMKIVELASHPKVIGIGETGLDYYYEYGPKELQKKYFRTHLQACQESGLPVIVHTRDAEEDTFQIMKEEMEKKEYTGLIHCFTASKDFAKKSLDLGLYISISGIVTFNKAKELQEIVKELPLSRILVETDSPYLAPTPHRGKRNEPAFTKDTAMFIANLKGISYEEVEEATTKNFFELFTKSSN